MVLCVCTIKQNANATIVKWLSVYIETSKLALQKKSIPYGVEATHLTVNQKSRERYLVGELVTISKSVVRIHGLYGLGRTLLFWRHEGRSQMQESIEDVLWLLPPRCCNSEEECQLVKLEVGIS